MARENGGTQRQPEATASMAPHGAPIGSQAQLPVLRTRTHPPLAQGADHHDSSSQSSDTDHPQPAPVSDNDRRDVENPERNAARGDGDTAPTGGLTSQNTASINFPAPRMDAKSNPGAWNKMESEHDTKIKLRRWGQAPSIEDQEMPSAQTFLHAFLKTRTNVRGNLLSDRFQDGQSSCFEGFTRFELHGTHIHAVWTILEEGLRASGPDTPGSRYFELSNPDGSVTAVSGIYCFKQELRHKCLFYSPAVLLGAVPGGASGSRPLAIRTVVELQYVHSDVSKRGKNTDQTILKAAQVKALHMQLVQAHRLELGTQMVRWNPAMEAIPRKSAPEEQAVGSSRTAQSVDISCATV